MGNHQPRKPLAITRLPLRQPRSVRILRSGSDEHSTPAAKTSEAELRLLLLSGLLYRPCLSLGQHPSRLAYINSWPSSPVSHTDLQENCQALVVALQTACRWCNRRPDIGLYIRPLIGGTESWAVIGGNYHASFACYPWVKSPL